MKLGIIGTGAYAIALTSLLEEKNFSTIMWTKLENEYNELTNNHTNLSIIDYKLKSNISFTMSLENLSNESRAIIIAIPAKFLKDTIKKLKPVYYNQPILIATKGMVKENNLLIHEYLQNELNTNNIACISGPSFAKDIILKQPIGLTIGSNDLNTLNYFYNIFSNISNLSIEKVNDIISIELFGIFKNIIAIGSGILNGMNINPSTVTKFLYDASLDIKDIIKKLDKDINTFYTYAGFGDYLLTTTSNESRNYTFGYLIGKNENYDDYKNKTTIEGLDNLDTIINYLNFKNIKFNLLNLLNDIINKKQNKEELINYLKNKE